MNSLSSALAERVDSIFKSYEELNGPSETTTEDGFLEICLV